MKAGRTERSRKINAIITIGLVLLTLVLAGCSSRPAVSPSFDTLGMEETESAFFSEETDSSVSVTTALNNVAGAVFGVSEVLFSTVDSLGQIN